MAKTKENVKIVKESIIRASNAKKGTDKLPKKSPNKNVKASTEVPNLVGKKISKIELMGTNQTSYCLPSGKKVVLFFYPKDSTPGCTQEAHDFSNLRKRFANLDIDIFGISRDSIKSHENFKSKQGYEIELLSDSDEKACQVFNVIKMKNMYGKKVRGIERSTFFIDETGRVIQEWRGVKVPGHADEVYNYVKQTL